MFRTGYEPFSFLHCRELIGWSDDFSSEPNSPISSGPNSPISDDSLDRASIMSVPVKQKQSRKGHVFRSLSNVKKILRENPFFSEKIPPTKNIKKSKQRNLKEKKVQVRKASPRMAECTRCFKKEEVRKTRPHPITKATLCGACSQTVRRLRKKSEKSQKIPSSKQADKENRAPTNPIHMNQVQKTAENVQSCIDCKKPLDIKSKFSNAKCNACAFAVFRFNP